MTKKIFKILILFSALSSLSSCGSFSDAGKVLRNEKITNTDEFFIKKRAPLVLPPDYEKIPKPGSSSGSNRSVEEKKKIDDILNITKEKSTSSSNKTSVEKSILEKINK